MTQKYLAPEAVIKNCQRGIALQQKWNRGQSERALLTGPVSIDTVKSLYSYLTKAQEAFDPRKVDNGDRGPAADNISWYAHGGASGLAWCRQILKSENILKSYKKEITESDLQVEEETELNSAPIVKALNEELRQATFLALAPNEVDLHGDIYDENEVRKACHSFNKFCNKANLMHLTETDGFSIIESFIAPTEMILNDTYIAKGSWLTVLQFHNDELWEGVKSGDFNGVSIGATATVEYLED